MNMNMDVSMYLFGFVTCGRDQRDNSCRHAANILPINRWYDLVGFLHMRIIPAAFLLHLASVAGIGESDAWKRMQTLPAVGTCEFDSKVDSNKSALLILLLFF